MWEYSENLLYPGINSIEFRTDFEELCEANHWEFLENGIIY